MPSPPSGRSAASRSGVPGPATFYNKDYRKQIPPHELGPGDSEEFEELVLDLLAFVERGDAGVDGSVDHVASATVLVCRPTPTCRKLSQRDQPWRFGCTRTGRPSTRQWFTTEVARTARKVKGATDPSMGTGMVAGSVRFPYWRTPRRLPKRPADPCAGTTAR
jgi:hypothetical protein